MCPELPVGCRPTPALGSHWVLGAQGPPLSVITHTYTHSHSGPGALPTSARFTSIPPTPLSECQFPFLSRSLGVFFFI